MKVIEKLRKGSQICSIDLNFAKKIIELVSFDYEFKVVNVTGVSIFFNDLSISQGFAYADNSVCDILKEGTGNARKLFLKLPFVTVSDFQDIILVDDKKFYPKRNYSNTTLYPYGWVKAVRHFLPLYVKERDGSNVKMLPAVSQVYADVEIISRKYEEPIFTSKYVYDPSVLPKINLVMKNKIAKEIINEYKDPIVFIG